MWRRWPRKEGWLDGPARPDCPPRPAHQPGRPRRHPRGGGVARQPEERPHPPRLPARRGALHADARHHRARPAPPGGPPRRDRVGAHHARAGGRGCCYRAPPAVRAVQPVQAPGTARHGTASRNPVVDVARPSINREEGSTAAFSKAQARKLLDAPSPDTLAGMRGRAILSVGLQVGLRRAEIAGLSRGRPAPEPGL